MKAFDVEIKDVFDGEVWELHAFGWFEPGDPRTWGLQPHDPSRDDMEIVEFYVCDEVVWDPEDFAWNWGALDLLKIAPQHRDRWLALTTDALRAQAVRSDRPYPRGSSQGRCPPGGH